MNDLLFTTASPKRFASIPLMLPRTRFGMIFLLLVLVHEAALAGGRAPRHQLDSPSKEHPEHADISFGPMELAGASMGLEPRTDDNRPARRSFASMDWPGSEKDLVPKSSGMYTDSEKSAAVAIDHYRRRNETLASQCISRSHDDEFRFSLHMWRSDNLNVTLPADRVLADLTESQRKALADQLDHSEKPNAVPNDALCGVISRGLRNGQLAYEKTDADAAKSMQALFARDESIRIAKRDADLGIGCVKRYYNGGGRDFAMIQAQCECQTQAIKANASDAQIDAWLSSLGSKTGPRIPDEDDPAHLRAARANTNRDWVTKAVEAAQKCALSAP